MKENCMRFDKKFGQAVLIEASMEGKIADYAMAWLHLTNNARENPHVFLKHWNNSGCGIFVVCSEKYKDSVVEYLEMLDMEVYHTEIVPTITPVAMYDIWDDELDKAVFLNVDEG